jgi:hypothetical protein
LKELGVDRILIFKCVLKKWHRRTLTAFYCLRLSKFGLF